MHRLILAIGMATICFWGTATAWQTAPGAYKVVHTQKNNDLGYFDYVFADSTNRRLYIPRRAMPDSVPPAKARIVIYDLDTLALVSEIPDVAAAGATVDVKSGHGFSSSKPMAMWDAKTLKLIKTIDVDGAPDGILDDPFNQRIYIMSHRAPTVTVIDAKNGEKLGTIDVEGPPEQAATDGKGNVYVDVYDKGYVAVIDAASMKFKKRLDVGEGCKVPSGLAIDKKNDILFVACRNTGSATAEPAKPFMAMMSAKDGKIVATAPLAGPSDGVIFNEATKEIFSSHGNGILTIIKEKSPTSFEVEQNLEILNGAKTITLDSKTGQIFTMSADFGPPPAPAPGAPVRKRGPMLLGTFTIFVIGKQ
jgi:YVTN family beta-propeller protein